MWFLVVYPILDIWCKLIVLLYIDYIGIHLQSQREYSKTFRSLYLIAHAKYIFKILVYFLLYNYTIQLKIPDNSNLFPLSIEFWVDEVLLYLELCISMWFSMPLSIDSLFEKLSNYVIYDTIGWAKIWYHFNFKAQFPKEYSLSHAIRILVQHVVPVYRLVFCYPGL